MARQPSDDDPTLLEARELLRKLLATLDTGDKAAIAETASRLLEVIDRLEQQMAKNPPTDQPE